MGGAITAKLIEQFLGSTHIFTSAVVHEIEEKVLLEVAGRRLTLSQLKLLKLVALSDTRMISDVAAFLGVSNAAASKAVDKLVRRRLLRRTGEKADRRAIELSLTERSRRLLAAFETVQKQTLAKIFRQYSPAELRRTTELLDRLSAGVVKHSGTPEELCLQCGIHFREKCLVREQLRRNCFYHQRKSRKNGPSGSRGQRAGNGSR